MVDKIRPRRYPPQPFEEAVLMQSNGIGRWLRLALPDHGCRRGIRRVPPSRPHALETVFAVTLHKSQGSEFAHTALARPDRPSRC